jgi:hypothetical protein
MVLENLNLIKIVSDAFSLIFIAFLIDIVSDFIIKPGKGVVYSKIFGGLLNKKKAFIVYLALVFVVAIINPANAVTNISNFIQNPEFFGPIAKLGALALFFWYYLNKKAGWDWKSLGG